MRGIVAVILCLFCFLFIGCKSVPASKFSLTRVNDSVYFIELETGLSSDRWHLPYHVFRYQTGDIDNNGSDEFMVGVIKKTRFDPKTAKRLFIFKNYEGYIRPLWMGSQLGHPLIDFRFAGYSAGNTVRCMLEEESGYYAVAEYQYKKFGLDFIHYLGRELDHKNALKLLNKDLK